MFNHNWVIASFFLLHETLGVQFNVLNKEVGDIWIGILGNAGKSNLNNGGFVLRPGQTISVNAPDNWAGRFWARTWCNSGSNHCETGDCGNRRECNGAGGVPPATLAEIALNGHGNLDYYDISLVDGFNLKASIEPIGGRGDGSRYSCRAATCNGNINGGCPGHLQVRNSAGIIACKSDCVAFNNDQACCRGAFGNPRSCSQTSSGRYFKSQCPDAYGYAYDDTTSTFTCKAGAYNIAFGG